MNIFRLLETRGLAKRPSGLGTRSLRRWCCTTGVNASEAWRKDFAELELKPLRRKWRCLILAPLRGCMEATSESVERPFQIQLDPTAAGINFSSPHESPLLRWHRPQAHRNESAVSHLLPIASFLQLFLLAKPAAHGWQRRRIIFWVSAPASCTHTLEGWS